jgi:preprotein translocase subunit SecA
MIDRIRAHEKEYERLSDAELHELGLRLRGCARGGQSLDELLPSAFGAMCVVLWRHTRLRPFDVQLAAGIVIHQGGLAELATGEGKTLVATLPAFLNALPGKGVHVATVNDYLAGRDADWFRPAYEALGVTVGVLKGKDHDRGDAYRRDVTYGTASEFGFDFLRDRLKLRGRQNPQADLLSPWRERKAEHLENRPAPPVQRGHAFAIVDEADNILIDEARTPLLISMAGRDEEAEPDDIAVFKWADEIARRLTAGLHFYFDDDELKLELTREGKAFARWSSPPAGPRSPRLDKLYEHLERSLHAHHRFRRDQHYMVIEDKVVLLGEGSGRAAPGRHWTQGLHQAVEAKEGLPVSSKGDNAARVTYQAFWRLYEKLGGMTGTAAENAGELRRVYSLCVVKVPTNRPVVRTMWPPRVFATETAKFQALVEEVLELRQKGRPILVGTDSVERSEKLSPLFTAAGIEHQVLNARYHEQEAKIVAGAGQAGRVTISTNMAGRGTDIHLGPGVAEAGGLHVILTHVHNTSRGDRQLHGRAGRQGDPGSGQFFVSFDDQLLEIFGEDVWDRLKDWAAKASSEQLAASFGIFRRAQRMHQMRHYDQRFDLLLHEQRREELLKNLGADPFVD